MSRCLSCFKEYDHQFGVCPHCGQLAETEPREPIHLVPGTLLAGRYLLGQAIGSGGFGIVYKAWDTKLETIVAVKEFFMGRLMTRAVGVSNITINKSKREEYEYRKKRFLAEARNMAKFGSHRSIPNVFEFFEANDTAYIVMELLRGMALNQYLNQCGGKLDVDFAIMVTNEIGHALKSLHESGIIHRDVAPDNIFICSGKDLTIKLMDLGAAKLEDSTDEAIDIILKPGYSPTEQYDSDKSNVGPWMDIYALGATLYVMLTGVKPDESTNRKISDEVVPPAQLNPMVSENLSNTVMKAMALEKHMRFKNVTEFLSALNGEKKVLSLEKERKRRSMKRLLSAGAAVAIVAAVFSMVAHIFVSKQEAELLAPANISVWYSVADNSNERDAMEAVAEDFMSKFPDVELELKAIPESQYADMLMQAASKGELPNLFESTGLSQNILNDAMDLDSVINSDQWKNCLFLAQYDEYYENKKQVPLAIEIPVAYVITSGPVHIDYENEYFSSLNDFGTGTRIGMDPEFYELIEKNFGSRDYAAKETFLNNTENTTPVLLSTTTGLNEVRTTLINYDKSCVFYNSDRIYCGFTYEWSIGNGSENEIKAAEKLLSWMLGNVYQNTLMISKCSDGQIPVNDICFRDKIESRYLSAIKEIYQDFIFERKEDGK